MALAHQPQQQAHQLSRQLLALQRQQIKMVQIRLQLGRQLNPLLKRGAKIMNIIFFRHFILLNA